MVQLCAAMRSELEASEAGAAGRPLGGGRYAWVGRRGVRTAEAVGADGAALRKAGVAGYWRRSGTAVPSRGRSPVASGLRRPSTRVNTRSEVAEGQRPRRFAYKTVPAPQGERPGREDHPVTRRSVGPKRQAIHANVASRPKTLITSASGPGDAMGTAR